MLIRLRVKGFKSLADAEVHFGPFTCIAGANGSGKSNLFDAIQFLRDLTEYSIIEAATRVRDPQGKTGDILAIFTQQKGKHYKKMFFEADFLVPRSVKDDFNRDAIATSTFLNYRLYLKYVAASETSPERIELGGEALRFISKSEAKARIGFPIKQDFFDSVVTNERRGKGFISTESNDDRTTKIRLHQDGGSAGRPVRIPAVGSPKTVLGGINTNDYPTVLAARREMQSWSLLQLEPSALRQPDAYSADAHVSANGAHLPATLWRLGVQTPVSNRLATLLDDVGSVCIERDESRRTYTLFITRRDATRHPARSLSDGTLRFLALAIIAEDSESGRLICLEEPENGIHPSRIKAMLQLLKDIAVDTSVPVSDDNPLRQVIINTHSPIVVEALNKDDLIMARLSQSRGSTRTAVEYVEGTWRTQADSSKQAVAPGLLLDYLKDNVGVYSKDIMHSSSGLKKATSTRTVREYLNQICLDFEEKTEK